MDWNALRARGRSNMAAWRNQVAAMQVADPSRFTQNEGEQDAAYATRIAGILGGETNAARRFGTDFTRNLTESAKDAVGERRLAFLSQPMSTAVTPTSAQLRGFGSYLANYARPYGAGRMSPTDQRLQWARAERNLNESRSANPRGNDAYMNILSGYRTNNAQMSELNALYQNAAANRLGSWAAQRLLPGQQSAFTNFMTDRGIGGANAGLDWLDFYRAGRSGWGL